MAYYRTKKELVEKKKEQKCSKCKKSVELLISKAELCKDCFNLKVCKQCKKEVNRGEFVGVDRDICRKCIYKNKEY
jgi:hypothetical protein